jgi:hypothetical protein
VKECKLNSKAEGGAIESESNEQVMEDMPCPARTVPCSERLSSCHDPGVVILQYRLVA